MLPPLADPTRTALLRRKFAAALTRRFSLLQAKVWELVGTGDSFGLGELVPKSPFTANTRWVFLSLPEKLAAFQKWLATQIGDMIIGGDGKALLRAFVQQGMMKGVGRAFDDAKARERAQSTSKDSFAFFSGARDQFLRDAFFNAVAVEKLELLTSRVFTDLKNVTDAMSTQMTRVLADGLAQGKNPRVVGAELTKAVTDIGKNRATLIARTETIRAHAEGQLIAFEQLGVEELGVAVEWSTAGDNRVCPLCKPLSGIVLKRSEATGMIPRHPNCRCAWVPANVGESTKGQKRSKSRIDRAIASSVKLGGKKDTFGTAVPGSKDRPEGPTFNAGILPVGCDCQPALDLISKWLNGSK